MKICIVTSSYPRFKGDYAGYFIQEQALALARYHEVHVIYPTNLERTEQDIPLHLHPFPYPFRTYPMAQVHGTDIVNTLPLLINMSREIRRVRCQHNIDLFYAFWTIPSAFICSLSCGRTPFIAGLMGSDVKVFGRSWLSERFVSHAIKHASNIVALSEELKCEAIQMGARNEKVSIIPSGIDINKFTPRDKKVVRARLGLPDALILLFVGSLFKLKRVDLIIKAAANLSRSYEFNTLIVGDGPERKRLQDMASILGLNNIIFTGRVPHEDVPLYMSASDILVLASETEGLPSCVQEAMSTGLPVVASYVGGLPDLITNGVNGYLVHNEEELEKTLRMLISSRALLSRLGLNALTFAREHLSSEKVLEQINEVCESIVEQSSLKRTGTDDRRVRDKSFSHQGGTGL